MMVTVSGLSGLTNAYKSVLSAAGSLLINGASRWLEALTLPEGAPNTASPTTSDRAAATLTILATFITLLSPLLNLALSSSLLVIVQIWGNEDAAVGATT